MKLCTVCSEPSVGSRCPEHKGRKEQPSATQRGYDYQYHKLRAQALRLQPFCLDCGSQDQLTLDHSVKAWEKVNSGKRLTIKDVGDGLLTIRCIRCNQKAGNARGNNVTHV